MKLLFLVCSVLAMGLAAPTIELHQEPEIATSTLDPAIAARRALPALEHEEIHDEFGQYALRYVTAEGTVVSQRGRLVPVPTGVDSVSYVLITEGEVSFIGDDGELYVTKFTSGLDGTHVTGNHLPVVPEPIAPKRKEVVLAP